MGTSLQPVRARSPSCSLLFPAPAPTAIYTLSLHDALPISTPRHLSSSRVQRRKGERIAVGSLYPPPQLYTDRKSTRLNSSHRCISYAVFCLKKKKQTSHR